jgi:ABC-type thiamine transport system ATPase subunit
MRVFIAALIRHMQQTGRLALGLLRPAVIPRRGLHAGMPRHFRDRDDIRVGVEQVADKSPSQIMGGERFCAGLVRSLLQHVVDCLGHLSLMDATASVDSSKQPPGLYATGA